MADDATMSSSLLVSQVQDEKLKKHQLTMNVSQQLREKELIEKVLCT
jgi:hypothetical protein